MTLGFCALIFTVRQSAQLCIFLQSFNIQLLGDVCEVSRGLDLTRCINLCFPDLTFGTLVTLERQLLPGLPVPKDSKGQAGSVPFVSKPTKREPTPSAPLSYPGPLLLKGRYQITRQSPYSPQCSGNTQTSQSYTWLPASFIPACGNHNQGLLLVFFPSSLPSDQPGDSLWDSPCDRGTCFSWDLWKKWSFQWQSFQMICLPHPTE